MKFPFSAATQTCGKPFNHNSSHPWQLMTQPAIEWVSATDQPIRFSLLCPHLNPLSEFFSVWLRWFMDWGREFKTHCLVRKTKYYVSSCNQPMWASLLNCNSVWVGRCICANFGIKYKLYSRFLPLNVSYKTVFFFDKWQWYKKLANS